MQCWDRSLASSFVSSGQARCPTCRGPVQVDFEAEHRRLVFSKGEEEEGAEEEVYPPLPTEPEAKALELARRQEGVHAKLKRQAERRQATTMKLLQQARPVQVHLLGEMGRAQPQPQLLALAQDPQARLAMLSEEDLRSRIEAVGGETEGLTGQKQLAARLQDVVGTKILLAFSLAELSCAPSCVCGSTLQRVTGIERMRNASATLIPNTTPEVQQQIFNLMVKGDMPGVQCDLCDQVLQASSGIWTCENGTSTILHATAYDVCDSCIARHAFGLERPSSVAES